MNAGHLTQRIDSTERKSIAAVVSASTNEQKLIHQHPINADRRQLEDSDDSLKTMWHWRAISISGNKYFTLRYLQAHNR